MKRMRDVQWRDEWGEGTVFFLVDRETGKRITKSLYISYRTKAEGEIRISAKTENLDDAKRELKRRLRNRENAREGKEALVVPKMERVTVSDVLDAETARAERKKLASEDVSRKYMVETLRRMLGPVRALELRAAHIEGYRRRRLEGEGRKDGKVRKVGEKAIKNELTVLKRAFRHANAIGLVSAMPYIEIPGAEAEVERKKELAVADYYFDKKVLDAIEDADARDFVEFMLLTARRPKGIGALLWEWYDEKAKVLKVPGEKGGDPTVFSIHGHVWNVFERRIRARQEGCPFIFHRRGERITTAQARRHYYLALEAAGVSKGRAGYTLYDVKRTAMGVMVDAGLSVEEIMAFSGHRDRAMVERYVVRNQERQSKSVDRRDAFLDQVFADKASEAADKAPESPENVN